MAKRKSRLECTEAANRDIEHYALFHCLKAGGQPYRRRTQIRREARRIANDPKLYAVEWVHPVTLMEFRRNNVDPFAIIYAYFEPTASMPDGLVSIRAIRHGAQQNIRWGVEESRSNWLPLFTRSCHAA